VAEQPSSKKRSEKRQRQSYLIARCTATEKSIARDNATNRGLSLGDYLREVATGQKPLKQVQRATAKTTEMLLLKAELNKIGSNVNQIAKIANTEKHVSQEQVNAMLDLLAKCHAEIMKLDDT
jgi:hypothetical protein